jgi:transcriptional regulator with XRE-family HTH domain
MRGDMSQLRTYSAFAQEAVFLLGREIRLARKLRKWSESELATRAGISRYTLQKIEKGDMTCAIGLVFEAASLVGINLFEAKISPLRHQIRNVDEKIALLPKSTHSPKKVIDDDF